VTHTRGTGGFKTKGGEVLYAKIDKREGNSLHKKRVYRVAEEV